MAEFQDSDYQGLLFNVHANKGKDYLSVFPDLKLYNEFTYPIDPEKYNRNQIIHFIVLVYDKESPFRKKYSDITTRKIQCALEVGWKMQENGKFSDSIVAILNNGYSWYNDMIVAYIKLHYNSKYAFYVMLENIFYENLHKSFWGDIKNKVSELKQIEEAFGQAQRELTANDNSKDLTKALYRKVQLEKVDFSPEVIAQKLKDGTVEQYLADEDDEED